MSTLRAALGSVAARLTAAGIEGAGRDARLLVAHAAGIAPERLVLNLDQPLGPEAAERLEAVVAARAARRPMAQVLGYRDFWRHRFIVTPDVLDPRPDTEVLVAEALRQPFRRVLDLGTGSGAIVLSLLAERPGTEGTATDLSESALAVAGRNAKALGLADRVRLLKADWFQGVEGAFDLIVSNPPYISAVEMAYLDPDVRAYEPHLALTPGGDGLTAYRAIAAGAHAHLAARGRLMVEVGAGQGIAVAAIFAAAGLGTARIVPDLDGRDRVVAVG
jgi:release factor glutamine methyltransferase